MKRELPAPPFLYVLSDAASGAGSGPGPAAQALLALGAGAHAVQLRDKALPDGAFLAEAKALRQGRPRARGLRFINDRLDAALLSGADGVHLGDEDLPVGEARRLAGPDLLIGRSTHSLAEALEASRLPLDYLALGPIYPSPTRPGRPPLGPQALAAVRARVETPLVAIGGITRERLGEVVDAGADGIAVISAAIVPGRIGQRVSELLAVLRPTIWLVGFMGAGKSTVGARLAAALALPFVDLDREIEREAGTSVSGLFASEGEDGFRRRERAALERAAGRAAVVATGGGAPLDPRNRARMAATGRVWWLRAPFELIWKRVMRGGGRARPLCGDEDSLRALLSAREPAYDFADFEVDAGADGPEALAGRLAVMIREGQPAA